MDDDTHGLYLVARGLGPDPARTRAVQSAAAAAVSLLHRSLALDPRTPLDVLARLAVEDANSMVWRRRTADQDVRVVLTLMLVRNGRVAIGHVGHGRVLHLVGGHVVPLTVDHTIAGDHDRLGYALPDIDNFPNTLTRQLGERMFVDVDVRDYPLTPDTTYLLLSSGFEGIDVVEQLGSMTSTLELSRLPAKLIELARSSGQRDRLSALAIRPSARQSTAVEPAASASHLSMKHRWWSSLQRGLSRGWTRSA